MTNNRLALSTALLLSMTLSAAPATVHSQQEPTNQTLRKVEALALAAANDAFTLKMTFEEQRGGFETQTDEFGVLKSDIENLGKTLSVLENEARQLPESQQAMISGSMLLVREAAAQTAEAIEFYNHHSHYAWSKEETGYLETVLKDSNKIAAGVKNEREYEKLRSEMTVNVEGAE